jgi:hypothetical protein
MPEKTEVSNCTIKELRESWYKRLGIPHFQRGMVWGDQEIGRLLESLLFNTPCGSLIFWKPRDPGAQGTPLPGSMHAEYMILDGQQRIRSLLSALDDKESGDIELGNGEDDSQASSGSSTASSTSIWCLNLTRLPGGRERFNSPKLLKSALFLQRSVGADIKYLIPLRELIRGNVDSVAFARWVPGDKEVQEQLFSEFRSYLEDAAAITDRSFPLVVLEETEERFHLSEVVQVYNRINSSGKKVEAEERAFATLVSLNESTQANLAAIFNHVHPPAPDRDLSERDEVLQRRKEKMFGFKLFIRLFIQASSYHFSYSLGSDVFSFSVVEKEIFHKYITDHGNKEKVDALWKTTTGTIFAVHRALTEALHCDDLRFFPGIASLPPVLQLLIRFPLLQEERFSNVIAEAILRLMLVDPNQRDILDLVNRINRCHDAASAVLVVRDKCDPKESKLRDRMKSSNSLQDRYVLLLYWLLRNAGARDFSYEKNFLSPEQATRVRNELNKKLADTSQGDLESGSSGVRIQKAVDPEKQHIVPYSQLKPLYSSLSDRSRVANHEANNVGNLTYISHDLNGLEGLANKPLNLAEEHPSILSAHLLDRSDPFQGEITTKKFLDFSDARRGRIATAFCTWLTSLFKKSEDTLKECRSETETYERIEPAPRIFPPTPLEEDRIRAFDFDNKLEDALFGILTDPLLRAKVLVDNENRRKKPPRVLVLQMAPGKLFLKVHPNLKASEELVRGIAEKTEASQEAIYEGLTFETETVTSSEKLTDVLRAVKDILAK